MVNYGTTVSRECWQTDMSIQLTLQCFTLKLITVPNAHTTTHRSMSGNDRQIDTRRNMKKCNFSYFSKSKLNFIMVIFGNFIHIKQSGPMSDFGKVRYRTRTRTLAKVKSDIGPDSDYLRKSIGLSDRTQVRNSPNLSPLICGYRCYNIPSRASR